ncbi:hypothetical protein KA005_68850 [bacterium]|nr:hypothetical protein [bacterium]
MYNQDIVIKGGGKMAKENGTKNSKGAQRAKNRASKKNDEGTKEKKRGWNGVFESVIYSSGPEDNIYVFG